MIDSKWVASDAPGCARLEGARLFAKILLLSARGSDRYVATPRARASPTVGVALRILFDDHGISGVRDHAFKC